MKMGPNATGASFLQAVDDILGDMTEIERKTQTVVENCDIFD